MAAKTADNAQDMVFLCAMAAFVLGLGGDYFYKKSRKMY